MAGFDQNNFIGVVFLIFIMFCEVITDKSCDFDIEETLNTLFGSQDNPSIQVRALRQDLLKKLQKVSEKLEREEDENRRSLSLAKYNNFPGNKRNLESLARAGYIKTLPDQDDVDANYKRKKRGIESLARYGGYKTNKDLVRPSRDYYVRNPEQSEHHSYNAKRSAKFGDPYDKPKRNEKQFGVNDYPNEGPKDIEDLRKQLLHIRYLSTLKNMGIDNNYEKDTVDIPDYDINQDSNTASTHSNYGKRFLGRLPQMGKPKSTATPNTRRYH
ncbi:hypothetical protein JTB14_019047 [Gonioctena quinquepunctata]|nr:hypothetical protein JTB14_019047 [Gonioctena quinquepunctata]